MPGKFKFFLNGIEVDNPVEWNDISEVIEFDYDLKGLVDKFPNNLTFGGSGHAYIDSVYNSSGYCEIIELECQYSCNSEAFATIFDGSIFLSDCKFYLDRCTVETTIIDNGWYARIDNNKKIKAYLNTDKSKNGFTITPCTDLNLKCFNTAGTYLNTGRIAYDVGDAFRYLIDFMTDGNVGFVSDWYSNLQTTATVFDKLCISIGNELRCPAAGNSCAGSGCLPDDDIDKGINISFEELFAQISAKFNLVFIIEKIAGVPTVRIEEESYLYTAATGTTLLNVPGITREVETERLYAKLILGGEKVAEYDPTLHSLPPLKYIAFQKEEYHTQGVCNKNRELNTVSKWIIDSNIIQGLVFTDACNKDFDEDVCIIEYYSNVLGNYATQWRLSLSSAPLYNNSMRNSNVAYRYNIQGDIAAYLSTVVNTFRAENSLESVIFTLDTTSPNLWPGVLTHPPTTNGQGNYVGNYIFPYNDDSTGGNTDPGNNYNTANYIYICPQAGSYTFGAANNFKGLDSCSIPSIITSAYQRIRISRFDSGLVLQEFQDVYSPRMSPVPNTTVPYAPLLIDNVVFNCSVGDIIRVSVDMYFEWADSGGIFRCDSFKFRWSTGGEFFCRAAPSGGVYQKNDPENYNVSLYKFTFPINNTQWQSIKSNKVAAIEFSYDNTSRFKGYIRRIERNIQSTHADVELVTNINLNP